MCYCPNFLERDNQTLVDNAEACTTSPLKGTAHTLRFHGQNGSCDIIPRHNPEMLLKSPAPLHDNIHLAVLFVTLLVVTIHRHHPELHQQPQFDAWLQRNNITNEVRKVMQKVAGKCRQMGIVPVSLSLFSAAAAAAAASPAAAAAASPAVAAAAAAFSSSAAAASSAAASSSAAACCCCCCCCCCCLLHADASITLLQAQARLEDEKEPEVDESVADDDDPEEELNVSKVAVSYI